MKRTVLFLTLIIVPYCTITGMDEQKKKIKIPLINIQPPSGPPSPRSNDLQDTSNQTQAETKMLGSPRLHPNENETEMLARGDKELYTAITSNDITVLNTFLYEASTSKNFATWWQDFVLNADIVTTPLTANDKGDTYTLINTLIQYDTNNPIDGSHTARIAAIFSCLHPSAQRSTHWLDTAIAYNNPEARTFISQSTMKRDNSSFVSDGSDESNSPRPDEDSDENYESIDVSSHDSSDGSDSEHERISTTIKNSLLHGKETMKPLGGFQISHHPIFLALIGIASCIIINGLLYLYYQDAQETDEDSTSDTDNDLDEEATLEIIL